ncbi:MAG TPA: FGGY-family carbohydrate kinase, partial [Acidobacteriota bacterium]|nr:FGGY-family carbohydrate kinase [Acidobacteriota bacterium]
GISLGLLKVDGGASANDTLMQLQADILGKPVVRPHYIETTVLGAAFAAGLGAGLWESPAILREYWQADRVWEPQWEEERRELVYRDWHRAIERACGWLESKSASTSD